MLTPPESLSRLSMCFLALNRLEPTMMNTDNSIQVSREAGEALAEDYEE